MTENPESPERNNGYHPVPAIGCFITVLLIIFWAVGYIAIEFAFYHLKGSEYTLGLDHAAYVFIYTLFFASACWAVFGARDYFREVGIKINRWFSIHLIVGTISGVSAVGIAFGIIALAGDVTLIPEPPPVPEGGELGTWSWPVAILMFALYAGEEEVLIRGLVYPFLKRSIGFIWAVAVSALIFSFFHVFNNAFSPLAFIDIFLAGVFLALMRELTGNLWLAWGAHFGWNFALVASGVPVSGMLARLNPQNFHLSISGPEWITGGGFGPEGGVSGILADVVLIIVIAILLKRNSTLKKAPSVRP